MNAYTLTKTRFRDGIWEGLLIAGKGLGGEPEIGVTADGQTVPGVTLTAISEPGRWRLAVPVPAETVGDGVTTFLIRDAERDTVLERFTLLAGEVLDQDLRAEVDLLRAELDMLKRAFRRHCTETE